MPNLNLLRQALLSVVLLTLLAGPDSVLGQDPQQKQELSAAENELFGALEFRYVGPNRGGRVTAVAGTAMQPGTFYFGATGGGVWKSTDYGISWSNVSDGFFGSPSIGDINVAANDPNIIYVGTGSDGLRSNVIPGDGVYKSIDGGASWKHLGLEKTGHIGAVEIDPRNHNTVFVAAIGNAFSPNPERGVYRTRDGGASWENVLFVSDSTGFSDIEFMPSNPDIVYATAWRAERKPWTIISGSQKENGIYRSVDGGDTWAKIGKGLPSLMGKIDLATTAADSRLVYAIVEAPGDETGLYKSVDQGETFEHVSDDSRLLERAFYYTNLEADPTDANVLHSLATSYIKSTDGGKTWERRSAPHGDHHDIWLNPNNPDLLIQANDGGANVSFNGGETWTTQMNQPTAEIYQVEVDNQYPYYLYGGQQDNYTAIAVPSNPPHAHQAGAAGLITNVGGCETGPAVPSPRNPDIVYANCKGNFTVYNKATGQEQSYSVGGQYMYGHNPGDLILRFQRVSPIHVSPHNPDRVYHTSQYVHRTEDGGKTWDTISPDLTAFEADKQVISGSPITRDITGEEFYSTIYSIRESVLEEGIIWVGANDGPVHLTRDGGRNWTDVTPRSLPGGGRIDAVEPSPHDPATAYFAALRYQLGDSRPHLFKTTNFGKTWVRIVNGLPENAPTRVIREDPDREGLLYAGTDVGLFISFDGGSNWRSFQRNVPVTPITDMKVYRDDLVLSTMGRGFWILDDLSSLHQDIDKISASNDDAPALFKPRDTHRFRFRSPGSTSAIPSPDYGQPGVIIDYFIPKKADEEAPDPVVRLEVLDAAGQIVRRLTSDAAESSSDDAIAAEPGRDMATNQLPFVLSGSLSNEPGLNRFVWDMRHAGPWHENERRRYSGGPMATPGAYQVRLSVGDVTMEQPVELLMDPRVLEAGIIAGDVEAQLLLSQEVSSLLSTARRLANDVDERLEADNKQSDTTAESEPGNPELQVLSDALNRAEGRYTQPMLVSQIEYLYGKLNRADQYPGRDMRERFEVLRAEVAVLAERFERAGQ